MNYERTLPEKLFCSSRRTRTAVSLAAAVFFVLSVVLVIVLATMASHRSSNRKDVCLTNDCIKVAARLLNSMNLSVDPCLDFYSFTCGNWIKNHKFLAKTGSRDVLQELQVIIDNEIKELFERPPKEEVLPRAASQALMAYSACLNESRDVDYTRMKEVLDLIGGWPILVGNLWSDTNYNWVESAALAMGTVSVDSIFSFTVVEDFKNSSRHILVLDQPDELEEEKITSPAIRNKLLHIIKQMSEADTTGHWDEDLSKMGEIQALSEQFSRPKEERKNPSSLYNKMTVGDLPKIAPEVDWLQYMNLILQTAVTNNKYLIGPSDDILVFEPGYIRQMAAAMTSGNYSKRDIANYIGWTVVANYMFAIPEPLYNCHPEVEILKKTETEDRELNKEEVTKCIGKVTEILTFAADYILFRGQPPTHTGVEDLALYIRQAFVDRLKDSLWIDEETKRALYEKATGMVHRIGYPLWILNGTKLDNYFKELPDLDSDNLNNFLRIGAFSVYKIFSNLGTIPRLNEWMPDDSMKTVNAYYLNANNVLAIPMSVLQPPLFSRNWPWYVNFGALGSIIGHEITHGFDDEGMKWDVKGVLNPGWLTQVFRQEFEDRSRCFVDQFENFSPFGFKKDKAEEMERKLSSPEDKVALLINGSMTLGENIADSGGLIQTYLAYKSWEIRHGKEPALPGLESYTPDQMVFISYGATWCTRDSIDITLSQLLHDEHSPERFRVIGSVSNSKQFAEVFNCPAGSPMNPHTKCTLW